MLLILKEYSRALAKGRIPSLLTLKYYKRWNQFMNRNPLIEKQPWLTFNAIDFITKRVRASDKVFEYGGGASTLYFLSRVSEVVTVEHDREWFEMLQHEIRDINSVRWHGQLILPEQPVLTTDLDKSQPGDYFTNDPVYRNATFKAYSTFISQFNDEFFDIVLIDGRSRASCLFHAIPKVRIGGFLVLDNSDRKYYLQKNLSLLKKQYKPLVNRMGLVPYTPYFSRTTIWQRTK